MKNKDCLRNWLLPFLAWRILLFAFLFLAISIFPLQFSFLGGGLLNYLKKPYLWSWLNFDGEHYLSITRIGYRDLQYFYFPLFPIITRFLAKLLGKSLISYAVSGLFINHIVLLLAIIGIYKLVLFDYDKTIARSTIILLLLFPTSFYFVSFYTESLFLFLGVWSFYFLRKKRWILSGILASMSTATRIVGLALLPALLVELWEQEKTRGTGDIWEIGEIWKKIFALFLLPTGLLAYMLFLINKTGDPLYFLHSVGIFGQQRSSSFVFLPQVFYRYTFKILPSINYNFFPVVFTTWLEFLTAVVFGILAVAAFFKLRLSYALYLALAYVIPTLSGSFSSLPRYVLVAFPAFIGFSSAFLKLSRPIQILIYILLFVSLGILTSLFTRGYWVS